MKIAALLASSMASASAYSYLNRHPELGQDTELIEQSIGTVCQAFSGYDVFNF